MTPTTKSTERQFCTEIVADITTSSDKREDM